MVESLSMDAKIKRGSEDAWDYFKYMADFVGFTPADAQAIRESGLVIEKYIPEIVSKFYAQLLRYPLTREFFIKQDGSIDQAYLQLRMHHLTNFWRRTAGGVFDDNYARYVDYVGRAHTKHGADPNIYIPERYVIGQVGYIQHAISEALEKELHEYDQDLEVRALKAWNLLMMVILEMLSRAYANEFVTQAEGGLGSVDPAAVLQLAVNTYEAGLGMERSFEIHEHAVGLTSEIPDGGRKIIETEERSIGVFHHKGKWYALRNSCLHRGGPVCTGEINGDIITCPWHGYQYNLTTGRLLSDPSASLEVYPLEERDGRLYVKVKTVAEEKVELTLVQDKEQPSAAEEKAMEENQFRVNKVNPGHATMVYVDGDEVAVFNVGGRFYATQNACTHAEGPLSEGDLEGKVVTCPWHGSQFDVTTGEVRAGPARDPIKTYKVTVADGIGSVEA